MSSTLFLGFLFDRKDVARDMAVKVTVHIFITEIAAENCNMLCICQPNE